MTFSDECRFRTITRTRYLSLDPAAQVESLTKLYRDNAERLARTLDFCRRRGIGLYRMPSSLFPMSDEPLGQRVLKKLSPRLAEIGSAAIRDAIRIVNHPEQFVVLSSEKPQVVKTSIAILKKEALAMDLLGLPQNSFASLIIHGGKSGRGDALIKTIAKLPKNIRSRLCLENDEYSYSAGEILDICKQARIPMVFDNHHHAIHEKLETYDDPSFAHFTKAAADTWPDKSWQLVHLSNGRSSFLDRHHSDLIAIMPSAYQNVPWIEVEAKGKESAIAGLQSQSAASLPAADSH